MPEEFLCKEKFGRDIYWDPDKLADTIVGLCKSCKLERGKCPNTYIDEDTGDALYCMWYQPKKTNKVGITTTAILRLRKKRGE